MKRSTLPVLLLAAELRDRLSALGAEPAATTPEPFAAFLKSRFTLFR